MPAPQTRGPFGARGVHSGRPFDPENAGGPVRLLWADRARITHRGVDVVERHLVRFEADAGNAGVVGRLRRIANGALAPTRYDRHFYTHELREFVRYRRLGWPDGVPADGDAARTLWNDTHTATLEDYGLNERGPVHPLYHPDYQP